MIFDAASISVLQEKFVLGRDVGPLEQEWFFSFIFEKSMERSKTSEVFHYYIST